MRLTLAIVICSAILGGCSTTSKVKGDDPTAMFQQMQEEQARQMADLRDQINQQQSSGLTAEDVAAIIEARLSTTDKPAIDESIQPVALKTLAVSAKDGEFVTAELTENCIVRIMTAGVEVDRPTSAKAAAYVCSHVYGLNHKRTLEAQQIVYGLDKDSRKFETELKQDISDDSDIVLDAYGFNGLTRTANSN